MEETTQARLFIRLPQAFSNSPGPLPRRREALAGNPKLLKVNPLRGKEIQGMLQGTVGLAPRPLHGVNDVTWLRRNIYLFTHLDHESLCHGLPCISHS